MAESESTPADQPLQLPDDFWSRVDKHPGRFWRGTECWCWIGRLDRYGYGQYSLRGRSVGAHPLAYRALRGPIAPGLEIDHLCRDRRCVNPDHLEVVTKRENILRGMNPAAVNARKERCIHGHEFTPANTYFWHRRRFCRACNREHAARQRRRKVPA